MKKLTIDYKKHFANGGTVYTQTITTTFDIIFKFNKYINKIKKETKKEIEKNHVFTNEQSKIMYYLEPLSFTINYINLTTLNYFKTFYIKEIYNPPKRDLDFERILWRNTIIKVI